MRSIALVLLIALPTVTNAQLGGGGSSPSPTGGRPQSTRVGFFELLKSGGESFLELFADGTPKPTVASPKWDSTKGPRSSVMTFVEAMNHVAEGKEDALPRAMNVMTGGDRAAATDLLGVFDRLPRISPGSIPDAEEMEARSATRFELFPRGISRGWAYLAVEGPPDGSIVLERTDDGQWRFNEETVEGAADLLESLRAIPPRPRITHRGQMFQEIVGPTFEETPPTGWLFFAGVLAAAVAAAWLLWRGLSWIVSWLDNRLDFLLAPLLSGLRVPAVILAVTVGLLIASSRIHIEPSVDNFRWKLIQTLLVLAGTWAAVILIELMVLGGRRILMRNESDPYVQMATNVFRQALRVIVGAVLTVFVLQNVFDWNVTALVGGVGLLALVLSLAARDAVANLFGAATIFISRPFLIDDWVIFKDKIGEVADVGLQATSIRLLTGEIWVVPNTLFVDTPVENLSRRKYLRRVMHVGLTYDTPAEKVDEAIEILNDVLTSDDVVGGGRGDLDGHPPQVNFEAFGSYDLRLRADYWYMMNADGEDIQRHTDRSFMTWLAHCSKVNTLVLKRFNEAGLAFAFPTQTLHVEGPEPGDPLALNTGKLNSGE